MKSSKADSHVRWLGHITILDTESASLKKEEQPVSETLVYAHDLMKLSLE